MKKIIKGLLLGVSLLLLTSCQGQTTEKKALPSPNRKEETGKIVSTGRVDEAEYQAVMIDGKYEISQARALSASYLNSHYNLANFESGLLTLSKENYSVDSYLFREGQLLDKQTIMNWLDRKSKDNPTGLNPESEGEPLVVQQILEQDYLDKKTQKLAGISLGIAVNQVDYSQDPARNIDKETALNIGKKAAQTVIDHLRQIESGANVPITVGIFEQATKDDIAGGAYLLKGMTKGSEVTKWTEVKEEYITLPVPEGENNSATKDGISNKYRDFKEMVQGFFPNLSGFSAIAHYQDKKLDKMVIKIETKYYSETEIISFTQFVGKNLLSSLNIPGEIEVQINSIEGPQAFIVKKANENTISSHIFN